MPEINILTESDLRGIVHLDSDAIDCVEQAFRTLAGGGVVMPPILSMAIEDFHGEVDVKTAYVPGLDSFAIKISPGFFDNPKIGLPSTSGLMTAFSARTGQLQALLLDNGYLTDVRTAAAGGVAAKHLSRPDTSRACIIGTGMQAALQLQALTLVRPITSAVIWGRDAEKADALAARLSGELGIEASASDDLEQAVTSADIIVTTTPSQQPLVRAKWLRPGQHLTAMGSDQDSKNELDPDCLARADLYVPDRLSQTRSLGELRSAIAAGVIEANRGFAELGEIVAGSASGRSSANDITICDLTGTGVQDTAIATFATGRAREQNLGVTINS
jgi:ornithine cyclodeaminase